MADVEGWAVMIQTAARAGVSAEAFWRLSVREWRMLTARPEGPAMTRDRLKQLCGRWPDE